MAGFFSYQDIERPVLLSGFKPVKSNAGSHQIYKQEETGLMVSIPKHPSGVSVGVGQNVLETVVLGARLMNVNIGARSNKLNTAVANYILAHQKKCKDNIVFLVPEDLRKLKGIETQKQVKHYLIEQDYRYKKHLQSKNQKEYIN